MENADLKEAAQRAAQAIQEADAIFIGAGAGIGVDSGMPDFRGNEGFWVAYPPFKERGLQFTDLSNPAWFVNDPHLAWGFYGHRMNLYRATTPHAGFEILKGFCQNKSHFVFTSNVDGHFQKAGFNSLSVEECHGSIEHLQCSAPSCSKRTRFIWSAEGTHVDVDETTFRARDPLPHCPNCGALARSNILMFGDRYWIEDRTMQQDKRRLAWDAGIQGKLVVIEMGAGTAIPSVRRQSESIVERYEGTLIRINVREAQGPEGTISMATGALAGLSLIADLIGD